MRPKTVVVNTGLALVLLAAAVGAVLQIQDPEAPETPEQTATVLQGPVASTVSTTGNLNAPRTVGLPFAGGQQAGLVKTVDVEVGDTVKKGQVLATVDDRLAKSNLKHARAALRSAEAQLLAALEGQTAQEAELDRANIAYSIQQLANSQLAVANAREKRRQVLGSQNALVGSAAESLSRSRRQITRQAQASVDRTRTTDLSPPPPPTVTGDTRTEQRSRSVNVQSSSAAIDSARGGLVNAEVGRAGAVTDANQALRDSRHQATLAARNLHVARAQARVNAQGGRASERAAARAAIADAQATIADARIALANTILRSPFEGIVVDVAGSIGETPVGAVRGTSSSSTVPAGPGSVENRKAATQSGFMILSDLTTKFVTAAVNEADVGKVAVGQPATVTFPATGSQVRGTVDEIDVQENVVNNVVQYNVKVKLDKTPEKLGQSASVQIITADRQNVLSVPNAAIIKVGDQSILQVRRDGQDMKIPVTPGLQGDQTTEVTSPLLRAGDVVILPGTGTSGTGRSSVPSRGRGGGGGG